MMMMMMNICEHDGQSKIREYLMELLLPILQGFVQQGVQGFVMKPIPDQVELTPEQKALFPELTELRQQIENLQVNCSKC